MRISIMNTNVICPNCKGKKYIYDHMLGVFTLGLGYLLGKTEICETCQGNGYITIPGNKTFNN